MEIDGRTTSEEFINNTVNTLREAIPIIFRRKDIPKLFGGCLAVGTLANLGKMGHHMPDKVSMLSMKEIVFCSGIVHCWRNSDCL